MTVSVYLALEKRKGREQERRGGEELLKIPRKRKKAFQAGKE